MNKPSYEALQARVAELEKQLHNKKEMQSGEEKMPERSAAGIPDNSSLAYQQIVHSSPNAIITIDLEYTITNCNPAALQLFQYKDMSEAIGKNAYQFIAEESIPAVEFGGKALKETGEHQRKQIMVIRADGSVFPVEMSTSLLFDSSGTPVGMIAIMQDITERVAAENERKESEERFRQIFELAADAVAVVDIANKTFRTVNHAFCSMLGYSEEELTSQPFLNLIHPDDVASSKRVVEQDLLRGKPVSSFLNRYRNSKGKYRWLYWNARPIAEKGITIAIARDITEQHEMEHALRRSEAKFRAIFELSVDLMCITDINSGTFLEVNHAFKRILGFSRDELLSKPFLEFVHPDDVQPTIDIFENAIKKGEEVISFVNRYRMKNGEYRILDWNSFTVLEEGLNYAIAHDITERRAEQQALEESERRLSSIAASIPGFIYQYKVDAEGNHSFPFMSRSCEELFGFKAEEIMGDIGVMSRHVPNEDLEKMFGLIEESRKTLNIYHNVFRVYTTTGKLKWLEARAAPLRQDDGSTVWTGIGVDVTKQKEVEKNLAFLLESAQELVEYSTAEELFTYAARKLYKLLDENALITVVQFDENGAGWEMVHIEGINRVLTRLTELLGFDIHSLRGRQDEESRRKYPPGQLLELPIEFGKLTNGMITDQMGKKLISLINIKELHTISIAKDDTVYGNLTIVSSNKTPVLDEQLIEAFVRQVSLFVQKRLAEEDLAKSEKEKSRILDSIFSGLYIFNIETGKDEFINPAHTAITGYTLEELNTLLPDLSNLIHPEDLKKLHGAFESFMENPSDEGIEVEVRLKHKEGHWISILQNYRPYEWGKDGRLIKFISSFVDITDRVEAEQKLKDSEQEKSRILSSMLSGMYIFNFPEGRNEFINDAYTAITGYTMHDLENGDVDFARIIHPDDFPELVSRMEQLIAGDTDIASTIEYRLKRKDGKWIYILANDTPFERSDTGAVTKFISSFVDITDRSESERALRKSEQEKHNILQMMNSGINIFNVREQRSELINASHTRITGWTLDDLNNFENVLESLFHPDDWDPMMEHVERVVTCSDDIPDQIKHRFRTKDGKWKWLITQDTPFERDEEGNITKLLSSFVDITEQVETEETLKETLAEREVLLKEIHHRVKNNMQTISSLLYKQSQYVDDKRTRDILEDSMNRVKSMGLIHEQIYRSKSLSRINLEEYIKDFASQLFFTHRQKGSNIDLQVDAPGIHLPLDISIPVALILNELMTNSLKYAFTDKAEGTIKVSAVEKDEDVILTVSDSGKGLADDFDIEKAKTLGLYLVYNIVTRQLGGSLTINKNTFTMRFEI